MAERGPAKGGRGVPSFWLHRQAGTARRGNGRRCVATESEGCALRRAEYHFLRGGTMVWQHADREGIFSALRRSVCCVVTGPAGRCGYFSFSAYRRRQRKVPGKEARHSYFFERDSVQVHKSCHKEAGTAAFLSASQSPKGKKSRPKERSWLPQERGKRCTGASCVRRTGGGPARAAERRAGRSGQRSLRGVNCATARSARSGHGTRGRPWGQHNRKLHSATGTQLPKSIPKISPTQPKDPFLPLPPAATARSAADARVPQVLELDGIAGRNSP